VHDPSLLGKRVLAQHQDNPDLQRLFFDNPWWKNNGYIDKCYQDFPKRAYFSSFYKLVQQDINRAIVLMGPRRVGKTVMAFQAIDALLTEGISPYNVLYISLETPLYSNYT
jgi:predicted AAA+ superfamily ATPase